MTDMTIRKKKGRGFCIILLLILLDQITKRAAVFFLKNASDAVLIPGVLQLHYLENQSAAFSMDPVSLMQKIFKFAYFTDHPQAFLAAKMIFFAVLTVLVMVCLIRIYWKLPENRRFLPLNLILLFFLAGAAGNLIDRLAYHYVIDFIYFSLIDFPVFNVADIYVTCAAFAMIVFVLFYYKEEDFDFLIRFMRGGSDNDKRNI